ncbi:MAG: (Fe-S)-binding protein, partial [Deltaproteobacteria bacterium]|nr:(Fe-S)-binding protein [Deltaproteobacteria bacterium]
VPPVLPQETLPSPSCVRCGACMTVCPLYGLLGRETAVARGKLNLLEAWQEGRLISNKTFEDIISCCLLCGACTDKCAAGLETPELIKAARARLNQDGRIWHPAVLLAQLTWQAPHLIPLAAPLAPLINRIKLWVGRDSGLMWRLFPHLSAAVQEFPNPARRPLRSQVPRRLPGRSSVKIAFFVGCGLEALYPEAGLAFLSICRRLGLDVVIPPGQGCCGLLSESVGQREIAVQQARRFVQEFGAIKADYVVTACASCSYQLKRAGRVLAETPQAEEALRLAARVREASEFLVQDADYHPAFRFRDAKVVFHDPCHLHRGQGISAEPRALLREALQTELVEPPEKKCCGLSGAFGVMYPKLSADLGRARSLTFAEAGAGLVATSCTGCLAQLARALPVGQVVHLMELIC